MVAAVETVERTCLVAAHCRADAAHQQRAADDARRGRRGCAEERAATARRCISLGGSATLVAWLLVTWLLVAWLLIAWLVLAPRIGTIAGRRRRRGATRRNARH